MKLTRQKITLLAIFALFLAPVLLVTLMRSSWWGYQPDSLGNHGLLLQPAIELPLDMPSGKGQWLLLYVMPESCEQSCIDEITSLRQVHKTLGRKGQYSSVAILSEQQVDSALQSRIESIYARLIFMDEASTETMEVLANINASLVENPGQFDYINMYIVDPMLNIVMAYPSNTLRGYIGKDLKRLAKWSTQEKQP